MKTIILLKEITGENAISVEKGLDIRQKVTEEIKNGNQVELDFTGIESILSLFLNPAIGDLYADFTEEEVKENFSVKNVPKRYLLTLKKVIDRAKDFYKNKQEITKIIDEELNDD